VLFLQMDILYAEEKLGTAIYDMATSLGTIRQRLLKAHLGFHTLSDYHFPDALKPEWNELSGMLEGNDAILNENGDVIIGSVENTIENLSDEECSDISKRIYNLYFKLNHLE
jgi:hypothetical protein